MLYADGTVPVETLCGHFVPTSYVGEALLCDFDIPFSTCDQVYKTWLVCYYSVVCDGPVSACAGSAPAPGPAPAPEVDDEGAIPEVDDGGLVPEVDDGLVPEVDDGGLVPEVDGESDGASALAGTSGIVAAVATLILA